MEDKSKNIVLRLVGQHRTLQSDLGIVAKELAKTQISATVISKALKTFTSDLGEHLRLENDYFYVELLKKMEAKGDDTENTKKFINEMAVIGEAVKAFLNKYKEEAEIETGIGEFGSDFGSIVETLNIRIEAEESGVYMYWE